MNKVHLNFIDDNDEPSVVSMLKYILCNLNITPKVLLEISRTIYGVSKHINCNYELYKKLNNIYYEYIFNNKMIN